MSMTEFDANMRGLRREWLAARIFSAVGALLLGAIIGLIVLVKVYGPAPVPAGPAVTDAQRRADTIALCTAAVAAAQGLGILPAFARLASDEVQRNAIPGRYTCFARTDADKYQVTIDLMCKHLNDPKCITLIGVTQDGGGVLYQRR
jgi:hypothetical protein